MVRTRQRRRGQADIERMGWHCIAVRLRSVVKYLAWCLEAMHGAIDS